VKRENFAAAKDLVRRVTEKDFMAQVVRLARITGHKVYHTHDSRHSAAGFPDLVIVRHHMPRPLFVELKSNTGQLTEDQWGWRLVLENVPGADYRLWRPTDWDEIEATLTRRFVQ
jgi:hypothetical protein